MSASPPEASRVTTLELFFDLVFVFTITQLTTVLVHERNGRGVLQVVLMLGVIWWMYGGYAWLTNSVAPDRAHRRILLLGGMGAFLILALTIPGAFGDSGLAFGLAYVAVVTVHMTMFTLNVETSVSKAIRALAPYNLATALLVLAGGIVGGTAQYVLWSVAFLGEWLTPRLAGNEGFRIDVGHFVERHGLVVIVAIGESVVAIGIGAQGLPVDIGLVGVALLGLVLSSALWWTYFGGDDTRAERAMEATPPERRPLLAIDAFGYAQMGMLLGIVAIAAALKLVIADASDAVDLATALFLSGGVALFLLSDASFRRTLGIGRSGWRVAAALLALVAVPLGTAIAGVVQLAAVVVVFVGALVAERNQANTQRVAVPG